MTVAAVSAVKPHDVVVLILHPDAPEETAFAGPLRGSHVECQAAHFSKKLTPHVIELVMLLVEAVGVDEDHLQESPGYEFRREGKEVADGAKDLPSLAVGVRQGNQGHALGKIRAAKKVFVARRHGPEVFVRPLVLNVGFDHRRVLADLLDDAVLVGDHPVDHIRHGPRGDLGLRSGGRSGDRSRSAQQHTTNNCCHSTHLPSPQ